MNRFLRKVILTSIVGLSSLGLSQAAEKKAQPSGPSMKMSIPVATAEKKGSVQTATLVTGATATAPATKPSVGKPLPGLNADDMRFKGRLKERITETGNSGRGGKKDPWQDVTGRPVPAGAFVGGDDSKKKGQPAGSTTFVTGSKYGDTFQGERFNRRGQNPNTPDTAGHGQGRNPWKGGGQDQVGRPTVDPGENPPSKDKKTVDVPRYPGEKETYTNLAIIALTLVLICTPDPIPDGDPGTSADPIVRNRTKTVGQQLRGVVKGQGTVGGPGLDRNESSPGRNSGQAVQSGYVRGSDREMQRQEGGRISYEAALKAIQYTNPGRN